MFLILLKGVAFNWAELPLGTPDIESSGANLREKLEENAMIEVPLYEPKGSGAHLFFYVRKKGFIKRDLARALVYCWSLRKGNRGCRVERQVGNY